MESQSFADAIGSVSVIGTTVRIDFVTLSPAERGKDGKPKPVLQQRIIMTMDGFLHAAGKIQEVAGAIRDLGNKRTGDGQDRAIAQIAEQSDGKASKAAGTPRKNSDKPPFP